MDAAEMIPRVAALADALLARRWRLATAESCTGGLVAAHCTAVAGSSHWFDRGFVTYTNEAKTELVGVPADLFPRVGAVSEEVAVDFDDPVFDVGDGSISGAVVGAFDAALKDGFGVLDHRREAVFGEGHDELKAEVSGEGETGVDAVAGEF